MSGHRASAKKPKILIDLDEYYKLLTVRDHVAKQEDKINARCEFRKHFTAIIFP